MADEMTAAVYGDPPAPEQKKRVRASISDIYIIGRCLEDNVVGHIYEAEPGIITHSYARGMTDEKIAAKCVPHLAAHHVTTVREALYPNWRKLSAEMTVEERLDEMEARYVALAGRVEALGDDTMSNIERLGKIEEQLEHSVYRRLNAIDREVDGPKIEERLADLESRVTATNMRINLLGGHVLTPEPEEGAKS